MMRFRLSDRFWGFFSNHGFFVVLGSRRYTVNTPKARPLFSERFGYHVPFAKLGGYRLFVQKMENEEGK